MQTIPSGLASGRAGCAYVRNSKPDVSWEKGKHLQRRSFKGASRVQNGFISCWVFKEQEVSHEVPGCHQGAGLGTRMCA
eukprot:1160513-Pelagomonas_calceolata.AAC.24